MAWTAPAVPRVEPPYVADERTRLDAWLDYHRATLLGKCAGLTGEQLAQRPVASSALLLLGLVRHMAGNERIWFRIRFAQAEIDDLYQSPECPEGGEFALADPASAETDFATYTEEVAQAGSPSLVCLVRRSAGVRPEVRFRPVRFGGWAMTSASRRARGSPALLAGRQPQCGQQVSACR